MKTYDIVISGIGGQGVITLGNLLKVAGIKEGLHVGGAEKRGGAQREGGVTSHVRYRVLEQGEEGDERHTTRSGLIPPGRADMLIAYEPLEAVRHCDFLHPRSVVVLNTEAHLPTLVRMKKYAYPPLEDLLQNLCDFTPRVYAFDMDGLSREHFQDLLHISVISLGLALGLGEIPIRKEIFLEVVQERFPDFEQNKRGFELGLQLAQSARNHD
jgi:indolepyruvate ferredoxin oxidoreductase beta subunit